MSLKVFSFEAAPSPPYPWWDVLKVEGQNEAYLVNRNWTNHNGALKPGDEIEFEAASKPVYSNCEYAFVEALRRIGKEASVVE